MPQHDPFAFMRAQADATRVAPGPPPPEPRPDQLTRDDSLIPLSVQRMFRGEGGGVLGAALAALNRVGAAGDPLGHVGGPAGAASVPVSAAARARTARAIRPPPQPTVEAGERAKELGFRLDEPLFTGFKRRVHDPPAGFVPHGTPLDQVPKGGFAYPGPEGATVRPRTFLTPDEDVARFYTNLQSSGPGGTGEQIMPGFVRGRELDLRPDPWGRFRHTNADQLVSDAVRRTGLTMDEAKQRLQEGRFWAFPTFERALLREAEKRGYDTVRLLDRTPGAGADPKGFHDSVVVLNPSVFRSPFAKFDPARVNDPDMLASWAAGGLFGAAIAREARDGRDED